MSDFIHELKNDHRVIQQVVAGMSAVAELLDSGKARHRLPSDGFFEPAPPSSIPLHSAHSGRASEKALA